jgi:sigma-B regulation protein RsbU (phosphoserine phosphatase)
MMTAMNVESRQRVGIISDMLTSDGRLSHITQAEAEVAVRYIPMKGVSGDYYDLLPLREEKMGMAVGDVCGKGIGAAFLTASLCANLRAQAQMESMTSGELLARLNRFVYRDTPMHQFVTISYGVWDVGDHTFTYSNAGHPPVLHYQAGTGRVRKLDVGGIVLGVCEEMEYPVESVSLEEGDALVLYTDGITEASNSHDEVFGVERLEEVVVKHGEEPSEEVAAAIMNSASQFACQGWQDDVTLMVVKRATA